MFILSLYHIEPTRCLRSEPYGHCYGLYGGLTVRNFCSRAKKKNPYGQYGQQGHVLPVSLRSIYGHLTVETVWAV